MNNINKIEEILSQVQTGLLSVEDALKNFNDPGYEDLGFARIDTRRRDRCGFPEVIFCERKTDEEVAGIAEAIFKRDGKVLATRAAAPAYEKVKEKIPEARYNERGRTISAGTPDFPSLGKIHIVTAGTSDIGVAEEAAETALIMGSEVEKLYDAGVAGIHRLLNNADLLNDAKVIIVAAGMEGALPSVVGGLVDCPVIAVPTSVGYGAHFNGLAALLAMLNSCASNVLVTNIDNGFRAGYAASLIMKGYKKGENNAECGVQSSEE